MPSTSEEIKSRLSVVDVVGSYVRLIKAGSNFKATCPFHSEKTPSFFVSPSRDGWHCFGCGAGGDIFTFVSQIEGVEFREALKILADKAGVVLKKEDPRVISERSRLFNLLEEGAKFFESELKNREDVRAYLKSRGLKEETIKSFRLGYAPQSWDKTLGHLLGRGFKGEEAEKAGLAILSANPNSRSKFYDRFRGRIMFPVSDSSGRIVGFSGRIFEKDIPKGESEEKQGGKYINTPQTSLYDKSRVLYLWDKAKNEIRKENACILVEGQMDALMSHQAGVKNAVAVSGTSLGSGHLGLISRLTSKLIFAFDTDDAGEIATKRGVDLAIASGFDVNILEINAQKDPADIILEDPSLWKEAVTAAKPVIAFFLDMLKKKFGAATRDLRAEVSRVVLPYVALIGNEIEKAHWVQEVSKALGIREEPIWDEVRKVKNKAAAGKSETNIEKKTIPKTRKDLLEERLLGMLAWRRKDFLEEFGKKDAKLFSKHRQPLLECVIKEKLPPDAKKLKESLEKLALEAELLYGEMEKVHEEFHNLLVELEREDAKSRLEELAFNIRKSEAEGDASKLLKFLEEFKELSQKINK